MDLPNDISKLQGLVLQLFPKVDEMGRRIAELEGENTDLRKEVASLRSQLAKNSGNSSKPPSSDGYKRKIKNSRIKSGRKIGGQKGHKGSSLEFSACPDGVVDVESPPQCPCGASLVDIPVSYIDRRQVYDLPVLRMRVSEYRLPVKKCSCCGRASGGRSPIGGKVGYGPSMKSMASYLNTYQMLPFERIQEFFSDVFGHRPSDGFLQSCNSRHYEALEASEANIKQALARSPWIAADETSARCMGRNHWVHVAGNGSYTHYHPDKSRGSKAISRAGILDGYKGIVSHDRYASYDKFGFTHQLCCVHLLRELRFLFEEKGLKWAKSLYDLMLWGNAYKKSGDISIKDREHIDTQYDLIVGLADIDTPRNKRPPRVRGKTGQSPERNLLDALIKRKADILRFMHEPDAPFDNNQAERDLRMIKVKQKISGCFRSTEGLDVFCRIRGYISSVRKQGHKVLDALIMAMQGQPHFA